MTQGWRPPRALQGGVLAGALAGAAALEGLTGRGAFRPGPALLGLALVAAGLVLHLRARRALGAHWSGVIEVRAGHTVVVGGPYAWVRHPIYLAILLLASGSFLAHPSLATGVLAGGLAIGLGLKIRLEERALRTAAGLEYTDYAACVPALVPDLGPALSAVGRFVGTRRRRYALFFGATLWGSWLITLLAAPGLLDPAGQVKGTDFIEFYAAGRIVITGQADRLYDLTLQQRIEHEVTAPEDWPGLHGFLNPPFFALLFVPLALLPYGWALALWSALGLALVAVSLWLVARADPPWRTRWPAAIPWALSFLPVFAAVSYGQNSLLSLAILAATYLLLRRGRDAGAGLVLGALLYKPQLVLVLALALLADRRWRALCGLGAAGAVLAAASWAMSVPGVHAYAELSRVFPTMLTSPGFPTWNMHSLYGFFVLLLPDAPTLAEGLALVCSLAVLVVARRLQPPYATEELTRWYAAALWATALVSPHLFLYDLSLLVLAAALVWPARTDEDVWVGGMAVVWVTLVFSGPLTRVLLAATGAGVQLSVPVLAVVGHTLLRAAPPHPAPGSGQRQAAIRRVQSASSAPGRTGA